MLVLLHMTLQVCSQDFSREMHNFPNLPPPPPNSRLHRSTCIDVIMLSFVYCKDRPGWNNMFTFYPIPLAVCAHLEVYHSRFKQKPTFWCCGKESFVLKTDFRVSKKTNSPLFYKIYSKESNRVKQNWGNLYCRCCSFNFYTFFFNYSLFYFISCNFFTLDLFRYARVYHAYR